MNDEFSYAQAVIDFQSARRKADIQNLLSMLTGQSTKLLSYEDVRQKLRALESSQRFLKDIPIDAIVGSVGRYSDFNKSFLPLHENDRERWSRVMVEAVGPVGLPPIDVYQIGEVFFVLDGNHRVSVAKELGATQIQANITELKTKIPVTSEINPDDLIIKAEHVDFLEKTELNKLRPKSDLTITVPGRYPVLLEHIAVHQYYMGLDKKRDIPYKEAVSHWYDNVYQPVVEIISERGILCHFPERTEADMYIWLAKHREDLNIELGWDFDTNIVADDLVSKSTTGLPQIFSSLTNRLLDAVIPDSLESGPPPGQWREQILKKRDDNYLFRNILVAISKEDPEWQAFNQGVEIARNENGMILGLHVVSDPDMIDSASTQAIKDEFKQRCKNTNITGDIAVEMGSAARQICERAHWADLIIGKLSHPPADQLLGRLSSGFRIMVRRCSRPVLAVPGSSTKIDNLLLAYNGNPKSEEALYIAAYLAGRWQIPLNVLTIQSEFVDAEKVQTKAREYLSTSNLPAEYFINNGEVVDRVLTTAQAQNCNLILIGGYKASPVVEIVRGSIVDQLLRESSIPTLICR